MHVLMSDTVVRRARKVLAARALHQGLHPSCPTRTTQYFRVHPSAVMKGFHACMLSTSSAGMTAAPGTSETSPTAVRMSGI